jgi:glycosyltransferase involved in cell wall biosynthesis
MINAPLVSVIIPAFNAEAFISNCMDSIINQTYKNIEVIIVDDGSTDRTKEIIHSFKKNYNNITYIYQPNQGCSYAKNTGLQHINGDFVQYLDADDILSLDKIELQIQAIFNSQNTIAICKTVVFESNDHINDDNDIDTNFLYSTDDSFSFLLNLYGINGKDGMIQPNAFLVPIEIINDIGGWDTSISPSPDEDGEYFCRVILQSSSVVFTKGINYYRKMRNADSLSKKMDLKYVQGAIKSILIKNNHILKKNKTLEVRKTLAFQLAKCAYMYGVLYPSLLNDIYLEIHNLGFNKIPKLPFQWRFGIISEFIGLKNAIYLRRLIMKVKKLF